MEPFFNTPQFALIDIQTKEGKPLMAIPQRHRLGLEVDPLHIEILP